MTSFDPQEILDLLDDPDVGVEGVRERLRASIPAPTMDDIEWVDGVHDGLCAEPADYGLVRMIGPDTDGDIWFLTDQLKHDFSYPDYLTPIPGTRIDLAPRREPIDIDTDIEDDTPEQAADLPRPEDVKPDPQPGEAWLIEYEGRRYEAVYWYSPIYAHWAFVENREGLNTVGSPEAVPVSRLVREAVPSHPTVLTTVEDYENAPIGTIVAGVGNTPRTRLTPANWSGVSGINTHGDMAGTPRRVLRWGWGA